jgi:hypothetical protein
MDDSSPCNDTYEVAARLYAMKIGERIGFAAGFGTAVIIFVFWLVLRQ